MKSYILWKAADELTKKAELKGFPSVSNRKRIVEHLTYILPVLKQFYNFKWYTKYLLWTQPY